MGTEKRNVPTLRAGWPRVGRSGAPLGGPGAVSSRYHQLRRLLSSLHGAGRGPDPQAEGPLGPPFAIFGRGNDNAADVEAGF
jgi:hypothetical protein